MLLGFCFFWLASFYLSLLFSSLPSPFSLLLWAWSIRDHRDERGEACTPGKTSTPAKPPTPAPFISPSHLKKTLPTATPRPPPRPVPSYIINLVHTWALFGNRLITTRTQALPRGKEKGGKVVKGVGTGGGRGEGGESKGGYPDPSGNFPAIFSFECHGTVPCGQPAGETP